MKLMRLLMADGRQVLLRADTFEVIAEPWELRETWRGRGVLNAPNHVNSTVTQVETYAYVHATC